MYVLSVHGLGRPQVMHISCEHNLGLPSNSVIGIQCCCLVYRSS